MNALSRITFAVLLMSLLFSRQMVQATTYYVATTGSDANSGSVQQPFRTVAKGLTVLSAGDTLNIRGGTYVERINSNNQSIPTGTSFSNAPVIQGYPGETAIIRPVAGSGGAVINLAASSIHNVIFKDLVVDATGTDFGISTTNDANHVRFQNVEVKNATMTGVIFTPGSGSSTANELLSCNVHDNGSSGQDHGLYISTSDNLIQACSVHDNAGYGIHIYDGSWPTFQASNNTVRDSEVYNNSTKDTSSAGIILSCGTGNIVFNNIIRGNKHGIHVDYHSDQAKIYNNVIFNNTPGSGILIAANSTATNTDIKNNILYQNSTNTITGGTGTTPATNLIGVNPLFVNQAGLNLHLQATSPAINAGTTLTIVTTDKDGIPRPQASTYDIGAYEFSTAPPHPPTGLTAQ